MIDLVKGEVNDRPPAEPIRGALIASVICGLAIALFAYWGFRVVLNNVSTPGMRFRQTTGILFMPGFILAGFADMSFHLDFKVTIALSIAINTVIYGAIVFVMIKVWRQYAS